MPNYPIVKTAQGTREDDSQTCQRCGRFTPYAVLECRDCGHVNS